MRPILAIALLTVRHSVRSRMFVSLVGVLALTVTGLPLSARGDGTALGEVRVLLSYTLGVCVFLLGAALLWASSCAVSQDIEEKQIRLVVVKPLPRILVWLGKWIGLLVLAGGILALCGGAVYGLLQWRTRPARLGREDHRLVRDELLTGRQRVRPFEEPLDAKVTARVAVLREQGRIPAGVADQAAAKSVRRLVRAESLLVAEAGEKTWTFPPPFGNSARAEISLRFRFQSARRDRRPVTGAWLVGTEDSPARFSQAVGPLLDGTHTLRIPGGAFRPGEPAVITFRNNPATDSAPIVFDTDNPVEFLYPVSPFGANLFRGLVVVFCHLALLTAAGLTVSTLFSSPVAAFVTFAAVVAAGLTHFSAGAAARPGLAHHHAGPDHGSSLLTAVGEWLMARLEILVEPVARLNPFGRLSDGILVPWGLTGKAVLLLLIVGPAVLAAIGHIILNRRELAQGA